jgi:hypothetical protein
MKGGTNLRLETKALEVFSEVVDRDELKEKKKAAYPSV